MCLHGLCITQPCDREAAFTMILYVVVQPIPWTCYKVQGPTPPTQEPLIRGEVHWSFEGQVWTLYQLLPSLPLVWKLVVGGEWDIVLDH